MDYLVFVTKKAAQTALETIYSNMVKGVDSPSLLDVATGTVVDKNNLTPEDATQVDAGNRNFPVFGKNAKTGEKNTADGYTTAWDAARQTSQGKWVFQKPEDAMLGGVVGYTIEPYDPTWFPQDAAQ